MYKNFPYNSPYAFCENKVVNGIELEGLEHIFYAFVTDKKTSQISIVEVSRIDATVKLITGQVVNYNTSEKSYILGSDGNFHEIPEAWLNRSLLPNGESLEKSMKRINSWKINNQAYKISENVKALQRLSEQANVYLGVIFFASSFKATKGGNSFFQGSKYSEKVLRQMGKADDLYHGFPKSVDAFAAKYGQWSTKIGGDGKAYQWLKMKGSYGGKTGIFEYTKDSKGIINHRFFNVTK